MALLCLACANAVVLALGVVSATSVRAGVAVTAAVLSACTAVLKACCSVAGTADCTFSAAASSSAATASSALSTALSALSTALSALADTTGLFAPMSTPPGGAVLSVCAPGTTARLKMAYTAKHNNIKLSTNSRLSHKGRPSSMATPGSTLSSSVLRCC